MTEKKVGEKVASIRHTFGRNSNSDHTTAQNVSVGSKDEIERGAEYFVDLANSGRTEVDFSVIDPFLVKIHSSQTSFSIPRKIIERNGILPGHSVLVNIHEVNEVKNGDEIFVDSSKIVGRTEVVSDCTNSDGCHSSLENKTVYNHIGEGGAGVVFRNLRNGKEEFGFTSQNSDGRFSFPISVRKQIEAEPGDLIEIVETNEENEQSFDVLESNEKIDEMYEMVSELYEAYTTAKND